MTIETGDSTLINTWAATGTKSEPDITKFNQGWTLGEKPPFEWMNYIQNEFGQKLNHMLTWGGGQWNAATVYPVGAVVAHSGNMWIALSAVNNSEPTGANTNWLGVATVDEAFSGAYGDLTGKPTLGTAAATDATAYATAVQGVKADNAAPKNSPAITGTPTAPTQADGNNSTLIATTAFVASAARALTQLQAENPASTVFGTVSGQRLAQSINDNLNASGTAPLFACRAWVNFNGKGTVAIRASGNVSSITDNGVGFYSVNFATAMQDASYSAVVGHEFVSENGTSRYIHTASFATNGFNVLMGARDDGTGFQIDMVEISVAVFR